MFNRLILELTPLCNLSCKMCPRHYISEDSGYMSTELFKKLVDEAYNINKNIIILPFWRGESALHPSFIELMNYVLDKKLEVHISTNGHFMEQKHIDIFNRCKFVTFSIHSDIGYKNALKFVQQKNSTITAQASFVECEKTVEKYMKQAINDKNLLGFDSIRLYSEHTIDGVFGKSKITYAQQRSFCPKLNDSFVVAYDGNFSRCNHIWEADSSFNLNNISLKNAWEHDRMKQIRQTYPDNYCLPCDQWTGHTNGEAWQIKDGEKEHKVYNV